MVITLHTDEQESTMTSVASLLGIEWAPGETETYRLNTHAAKQAAAKGFSQADVLSAANDPHHTYDNGRYVGQKRHVRAGIVAVVDPVRRVVITVYQDQCLTPVRSDQMDADALRYGRSVGAAV
jgi:hypothetical protein